MDSLVMVESVFEDAGTAGPIPTSFSWSIQAAEGHICHIDVVVEIGRGHWLGRGAERLRWQDKNRCCNKDRKVLSILYTCLMGY